MNQTQTRSLRKKVLSLILAVVMVVSLLPISAFASGDSKASTTAATSDGYEYNIMFLDCGRKYYSVDSIKQIIDNASAAGFNYIQLAVGNDGLRFLLDDMSLTVNGVTYSTEKVTKAIQNGNTTYNKTFDDDKVKTEDTKKTCKYNPDTNELTQGEMDTIIAYANSKGMGVIPCVNTPGHMDAILSAASSLTNTTCSYNGSARTIDVTNNTAVAFTKALLQKYIDYFAEKGCQLFNMGADEYANDIYTSGSMGFGNLQSSDKYNYYVKYVNAVAKMIKDAGMKPMAFNDGIYFNNNTSSGTFDTDIIICYWSSGWPGYTPMSEARLVAEGFKLINTNGSYYWVLGKTAKCSAAKAGGFDKTAFPGGTVSNPVGSMFCIWADYPGAETEASVISKTAATIAAFGKALPEVGIKSSGGTALTLNGTTELTVPGNAVATWTVDPAGVIELQSSSNADDKSAITGKSVIAKAVGAGTAKVTATVDGKTTYTTTLTVTDPSTVDVKVAVNGTKTITVDGNYTGEHATDDPAIATVATEHKTSTAESIKYKASAYASIQAYWNPSSPVSNVIDGNSSTYYWSSKAQTKDAYVQIDLSAAIPFDTVRLTSPVDSGDICTNADVLVSADGENWTKIGSYTGSTIPTTFTNTLDKVRYIKVQITEPKDNWWKLSEIEWGNTVDGKFTRMATSGTVNTGTKEQTTITFTGKSVGDTSVQIGDVTYKIHVVAEDLSKVTPLTIEYWITNSRLTGSDGNQALTIQATDKDVATEAGVNTADLVAKTGNKDGRTQEYWQTKILDVEKKNNSTSGTELQVVKQGDDETLNGKAFTKVRYWGGTWQVYTTEWVNVDRTATSVGYTDDQSNTQTYTGDKNQLVAYYMEVVDIKNSNGTTNLHVNAADWGTKGDGTGNWGYPPEKNRCSVSVQLVYEDSSTNPADTTADSLKSKTIVYGYWSGGRGLGTMIFNGEDNYQIIKVTAETGTMTSSASSSNTVTVTSFKWANNEETVWEGAATDSVSIGNPARSPSYDAPYDNLAWNTGDYNNNNAILIRVYVKAIPKAGALTVNYFVKGSTEPFYHYGINVEEKTVFDTGFARVTDEEAPGGAKLINNTVKNYAGETQTIQSDLSMMTEIGAQYRYSNYTFTKAERSTDGKTVNLYYTFNWNKAFVVDFGLPVVIRPNDVNENLKNATLTAAEITQSTTYANISVDNDKNITYTLKQTIDGEDNFSVRYMGNITTDTGTQTGHVDYSIKVIPATSVYYEDSFATFTNADSTKNVAQVDNAAKGIWTKVTDGTTQTNVNQALEALGGTTNTKNVYGYDPAYANSSKFSMGSATKVTVAADTYKEGETQWPTATFTFKGTGFDVISLTDNTSGAIFVDVYAGKGTSGKRVKSYIVDNYYGYRQEKDAAGNVTWVVDQNAKNALYQIPVMKINDLTYGEYTAVITVFYDGAFNQTTSNQYNFWLDAIRVYNPMGTGADANANYVKDSEGYPQYIKLRDSLAKDHTATAEAVFIDGGANANIQTYANYGPNNEVYLAKGQAISFTIPENTNIASIQIGAKAPNGNAAEMDVNGTKKEIPSATEMYYEIAQSGGQFTITNNGSGILSLTNLKITFKTNPNTTVTLAALSDEDQANAVAQVRALFAAPEEPFNPDLFTASWGHSVRKGDTATLTVKTSEDVEAIEVDGQMIDKYVTRTERSGWGWWAKTVTFREFTYTDTATVTKDYTVCAVNGKGVSSDAITATLTVRPSVRDWLHGIFGKWF